MKKKIKETLLEFEKLLTTQKGSFSSEEKNDLLEKIQFFSQERLLHLIVTLAFALFALLSFFFFYLTEEALVLVLGILFVMLLIPYIVHYYFLENSVQKMIELYETLKRQDH